MADSVKLHIGCGGRLLDGFTNVDIAGKVDVRADVRRGLPFRDESVCFIFCEHFIEHLTRDEAIRFLAECRRVLEPGGVCRVATPDLEMLVDEYRSDSWREAEWVERFGYGWLPDRCTMMNLVMREWEHKHLFDHDGLKMAGNIAGFLIAKRSEVGKSAHEELRGLEHRDDSTVIEFTREAPADRSRLPLVSILIPAYNPRFLDAALRSALDQTYPNTEIVVCNDNPGSDVGEIVERFQGEREIRYYEQEKNLGAVANYIRCFGLAEGEYVKYLNDDDILHPDCVRRMMCCFMAYGERVSLVTSSRQRIGPTGRRRGDRLYNVPLVQADSRIHGRDLGDFMLRTSLNVVGEPTTGMFRKRDLEDVEPTMFSLGGREVHWLVDYAMWLNLLTRGDAVYLCDALSSFRIHEEQEQKAPHNRLPGAAAWAVTLEGAMELGYLQDPASRAWVFTHAARSFARDAARNDFSDEEKKKLLELKEGMEVRLKEAGETLPGDLPDLKMSAYQRRELARMRHGQNWVAPYRRHFIAGRACRRSGGSFWRRLFGRR